MRDLLLAFCLIIYAFLGYFVMKALDAYLDQYAPFDDEKEEVKAEKAEKELPLKFKERIERWVLHCYKHPRLSRFLFHLLNDWH